LQAALAWFVAIAGPSSSQIITAQHPAQSEKTVKPEITKLIVWIQVRYYPFFRIFYFYLDIRKPFVFG
jgi:hypothetical protein